MNSNKWETQAAAATFQRLIHAQGNYAHVTVRPRAGHLYVEVEETDGTRSIVARATPIKRSEYGLSFRTHTGRWETMPVWGPLEDVVEGLVGFLDPYLQPLNSR